MLITCLEEAIPSRKMCCLQASTRTYACTQAFYWHWDAIIPMALAIGMKTSRHWDDHPNHPNCITGLLTWTSTVVELLVKIFDVFAKFLDGFAKFCKFFEVFGRVWTFSGLFWRIRICLDACGCIRIHQFRQFSILCFLEWITIVLTNYVSFSFKIKRLGNFS